MIPKGKPYIIGETAFHHQGDINYLYKLIDLAHELQLDAIKFHLLLDLDDYFVENHPAKNALKEWIFTKEEWSKIFDYASNKGIDIISLCNDVASAKWVIQECKVPVKAIEIHATGINDVFLLDLVGCFEGEVMLGVGGSTIDQIEFAINVLKANNKNEIILMYGFQNYPTDYSDINLGKISILMSIFNLPVGYADHTDPSDPNNEIISVSAIMLGSNIVEKHFTLDISESRIDSQAAVSKEQMIKIKELCQIINIIKGYGSLEMSVGEKKYGDTGPMKKAIVAKHNIASNKIITLDDLAFKRTNISSYVEQKEIYSFIGQESLCDIKKDDIINFNNVGYQFKMAELSQFKLNK